jgi:NADH-quinone oxidoreductase subunit A
LRTSVPTTTLALGTAWPLVASMIVPTIEPTCVSPLGFGFGPQAASVQQIAADAKAVRVSFQKIIELMTPYGPVAIYLAVALAAALLFTGLPGLMARKKPNAVKSEAYECGVEPTSDVSGRFPVRFYLIAMLFVVFDVETASFYPWAVQMHQLRVFGLLEMIVFVVVLAIGYAYVWKRGGFQWR